ncbi:MAG: recombinase family protein [Nitrososphaerota archaeon]|nr:recombinase family protein [Nitrososphaerota archaeon]
MQSKSASLRGFVRGDQLPAGPPRVAIYARVSTTKQETENQVVQLREYAARMGWAVVEVLKETEHGWEPEREKLQELLDLARFREIDIALVWALDRFSRQGVAATLKLVEDLHRSGVKLWSYQEPFLRESDLAMSELVLSFLAWAAKQEHVQISERTKAGLERVRVAGRKLGRPKKHDFDVEVAKRLRGEGKSWNETIKEMGLPAEARGSVVRAVRSRWP